MHIIDSHTGGEPTRVILSGGPDLGSGPVSAKRERLRTEFDWLRQSTVCGAQARDGLVGAFLCAPADPGCVAGVIYFNQAGYLGMCGHATMGLAVTLQHLGRIGPGRHLLETPVGVVSFELTGSNEVTIENVPSSRWSKDVEVEVPGYGTVTGDVAWGGNWFFLTNDAPYPIDLRYAEKLTSFTSWVRAALIHAGITGQDGAEIDHIELCAPPQTPGTNARNFVLCPDGAFDRSPCGTGTSARLACLAADGLLAPGETWVQESVTGSRFEVSYVAAAHGAITPSIKGTALVTHEDHLELAPGSLAPMPLALAI